MPTTSVGMPPTFNLCWIVLSMWTKDCIRSVISCLVVVAISAACSAGEPGEVVPIEGPRFSARLAGIEADLVRLADESQTREVALDDLVSFGAPVDAAGGSLVLLADGGVLVADVLAIADDRIRLDSASFAEVSVPVELVAAVLFHPRPTLSGATS